MPKISLIIFTLNEIDGMKVIMPQIRPEWYDELLVVDGGSTDGTIEYCHGKGYPYFVQLKPGMAAAYKEAMDRITGNIVIFFSPDGNSPPELIPQILWKMEQGCDVVVVSRYLPPAKSQDDDLLTGFGNWMFSKIGSVLFGYTFTDLLNFYMGVKTRMIWEEGLFPDSPSWASMIKMRAVSKGYKYAEIPGNEPKRIGGKRKLRPFYNGLCEARMIWKEYFRSKGAK